MNLLAQIFRLADVTVDNNGKVTPGSGLANPNTLSVGSVIHTGVNAFAFVIGAVSIIMVLVGAFRYTISAGNPQATKDAKDTILYAIVGLIIAILSLAIINFVLVSVH